MRSVKSRTSESSQYKLMRNGVIKIERECPNIFAEYKPAKIPDYLGAVDHTLKIGSKKEYKKHLRKQMKLFNEYVHEMKELNLSLIIALQGRDGAGKTGTVTTLDTALWHDYRIFKSVPMGPPTEEEMAHPYLWRMSRYDHMPSFGQVRVFDRTWQERVLVEKVMELTPEHKLRKSYAELRDFEWGLIRHGAVVVKIWLDITHEEQGRRFEERVKNKPGKKSKSDDVARAHWHDYTPAANEAFYRTGTKQSPQYVISSEDKSYCHVAVLEVINHELRRRIRKAKEEMKRNEPSKKSKGKK